MKTVEFEFQNHNSWIMGPACSPVWSINPAHTTTSGIYIIHNANEDTTYVGYADNARDRWSTRTEVFHIMGIPQPYGANILCAFCLPSYDGPGNVLLKGQNACEHLLIRAVVNGLLGRTTNTNTQLVSSHFINSKVDRVRVYLPSDPWARLRGRQEANVGYSY